jgi:hypothetical protein
MKLEVTDYIASLKEENELDQLIQDLLREFDFEIVFGPQKGERQYGVDIYAVGEDWQDNKRKVFLITVKQGDLDRKNWEGSVQAIEPSLRNILSVFIRNNVLPEHKDLPIKIIVAHNGINISAIQQNWRGFADSYPRYEFALWQLETISNLVTERMINENVISTEARPLLRRIIIYLDRPDYDFSEFSQLIDDSLGHISFEGKNKKANIRQLRKINLILSIIVSFCKKEENLKLALRATEIGLLRMWKFMSEHENKTDNDYFYEFIRTLFIRKDVYRNYLDKMLPLCEVRDGFSRGSHDAVTYTLITYEHLGLLALGGLESLQLSDLFELSNKELSDLFKENARYFLFAAIRMYNNNRIVFNPRADDHIIEWNLVFILLKRFDRPEEIRQLLTELNKQIGNAKVFFNQAPVFSNSLDEMYELAVNYKKRDQFKYDSSTLLPILAEWAVVLEDKELYASFIELKKCLFESLDLILWYPDKETEKVLFSQKALSTGYSLSDIELLEDFDEFKTITLTDYVCNCQESEFNFFKHGLWCIGLTACRHYRTHIPPFYWRQFLSNQEPIAKSNYAEKKI